MLSKGLDLKRLMPKWLQADIEEIDLAEGWLTIQFSEPGVD